MIIKAQILHKASMFSLGITLLAISACGDSDVAGKAKEYKDAANAIQQGMEIINAADKIEAGSGNANAAELVAEHGIHWTHRYYFPAEQLEGKTGMAAMYVGIAKLEKLAGNESLASQIRECHERISMLKMLARQYKSDNEMSVKLFSEAEANAIEVYSHSSSKDHAMTLNYIRLLKQYDSALNEAQVEEVNEAFWQWCTGLPVAHWQGPDSQNPIKI